MKRRELNLSMPGQPSGVKAQTQPIAAAPTPAKKQPQARPMILNSAVGSNNKHSTTRKPLNSIDNWKSELETTVQLFRIYDKKEYLNGRLMRLHDLNSDGHAARHREWQMFDVTVKGSEMIFTNTTTNVRDTVKFSDGQVDWIGVFQKLTGSVMSKYGVLSLNTAGSNRYFLKLQLRNGNHGMPTTEEIVDGMRLWASAIRTSQFEELVLNQMFTETLMKRPAYVNMERQLIPADLSKRATVRIEGSLKMRLAGHTKWQDYYCIGERLEESDEQKFGGKAHLLVFADKKDAEKHMKQPPRQLLKTPLKYVMFKLVNIDQAFTIYPDRKDFIDITSIFKIQNGSILLGDKAPRDLLKTAIPNLINWGQKVDELARKQPHVGFITQPFVLCMAESQEMMIKWLLNIWSVFDLHGKGMLPDDENNNRLRQILTANISSEKLWINVEDVKEFEMRSRDVSGYHREFLKIAAGKDQKMVLKVDSKSEATGISEALDTNISSIGEIDDACSFTESETSTSDNRSFVTAIKATPTDEETVHFVDSDAEDDVKTVTLKRLDNKQSAENSIKKKAAPFATLKNIEGKPIPKAASKKPSKLQVKPPVERRKSNEVKSPKEEVKQIAKQVLSPVKDRVPAKLHRKSFSVPTPKPEINVKSRKSVTKVQTEEKKVPAKAKKEVEQPITASTFNRNNNRKTLVIESAIEELETTVATDEKQDDLKGIERAKIELQKERELLQKQMEAFETIKFQMQQSVYAASEYGPPASMVSYHAPVMMGMPINPQQQMMNPMMMQVPVQYVYPTGVSAAPSDSENYDDEQEATGETGGGLISLISENTKNRSTAYNPQLGILQPHSGNKNAAGLLTQAPQFRNGQRAVSTVGVAPMPVNPYMNMNQQMQPQMMHQQQFLYPQFLPNQQYPNGFQNQFYGNQKQ